MRPLGGLVRACPSSKNLSYPCFPHRIYFSICRLITEDSELNYFDLRAHKQYQSRSHNKISLVVGLPGGSQGIESPPLPN